MDGAILVCGIGNWESGILDEIVLCFEGYTGFEDFGRA